MLRAQVATPTDYSALSQIWWDAVTATHDFLTPADQRAIAMALPTYFAQVDLLAWYADEQLIGFSGRQGSELVMLFIAPSATRHGYGRQIITQLDQQSPVRTVDVNEQNHGARKFYAQCGFQLVSRDAIDGDGRPYPILHLRR